MWKKTTKKHNGQDCRLYSGESATVGRRQCREPGAGTADILLEAAAVGSICYYAACRLSLRTLDDLAKMVITFTQYDFYTFCHSKEDRSSKKKKMVKRLVISDE